MSDRRCPNCGERVPSTSITCPKCYKKLPIQPQTESKTEKAKEEGKARVSKKTALIVGAVLGLFGFLGIGQLCLGRRSGLKFLIAGLVFFVPAMALSILAPGISIIFVAPLFIIYAVGYLVCLFDLLVGELTARVYRF